MSDDVKPKPPEAAAVAHTQKSVSGYLVFSLLLSVGGFFLLPVVGAAIGLVLALVGRKRVRQNEMLVGPRFAVACLVIAAISLPAQGWLFYKLILPQQKLQEVMAEVGQGLREGMRDRSFDRIHAMLPAAYRREHSAEEFTAMLESAFPGDRPIEFGEKDVSLRASEEEQETIRKEIERLLAESTGTVLIPQPLRIAQGEDKVDLDFTIEVSRQGHLEFEARLVELRAERVGSEGEETPPKEGTGGEDTGGDGD